jgi:WD40 repeat protein
VAVSQRGNFDLLDLDQSNSRSTRLVGAQEWIEHAAMARGGDRMVTAGWGEVVVWRTASNPLAVRIPMVDTGPVANALSADGRHMYSAGTDARIHELDTTTGGVRTVCSSADQPLSSLAITRAGTLAVTGGEEGLVAVCDLTTGRFLARRQFHGSRVVAVAIDASGSTLLSASAEGRLVLSSLPSLDIRASWNVNYGTVKHGKVMTAALEPNTQRLAVGTDSGWLQLIPTQPGAPQPAPILPDGGQPIGAVAFAPNSELLAYGDALGRIVIHDLTGTHSDIPVSGHAALVQTLRFDRSSNQLTSLSRDRTIAQWDTRSGIPLSPLLRSDASSPAGSLDITPEGELIAVVQGNNSGYLWHLDRASLIAQACLTANRTFTISEAQAYLNKDLPYDPCQ